MVAFERPRHDLMATENNWINSDDIPDISYVSQAETHATSFEFSDDFSCAFRDKVLSKDDFENSVRSRIRCSGFGDWTSFTQHCRGLVNNGYCTIYAVSCADGLSLLDIRFSRNLCEIRIDTSAFIPADQFTIDLVASTDWKLVSGHAEELAIQDGGIAGYFENAESIEVLIDYAFIISPGTSDLSLIFKVSILTEASSYLDNEDLKEAISDYVLDNYIDEACRAHFLSRKIDWPALKEWIDESCGYTFDSSIDIRHPAA